VLYVAHYLAIIRPRDFDPDPLSAIAHALGPAPDLTKPLFRFCVVP